MRRPLVALRAADVVETLRPCPVAPFPGAPPFVLGSATIRGEIVPVVDPGRLSSDEPSPGFGRFVVVRVGARKAALAVEAVEGVHQLSAAEVRELPPLFRDGGALAVKELASRDGDLLLVLEAGKLISEEMLGSLSAAGGHAS